MSTVADQPNIHKKIHTNFEILENKLNGTSKWPIHQVRKQALSVFNEQGLPGVKHEEYKYTQLGKALEKHFDFTQKAEPQIANIEKYKADLYFSDDLINLSFVNGQFVPELSDKYEEAGINILEFSEAYEKHQSKIDEHFSKYAKVESDPFIALNTAFAENGAYIEVVDNKIVEKPVFLNFITDSSMGEVVTYPRNLIIAGKNSQVSVVERYLSDGDHPSFVNSVFEAVVYQDAILNYYLIEREGENNYHLATTQINQVEKSYVNCYAVSLSGAMVRNNLNLVLDAEYCESNMFGIYLLNGKSHVDNHTMVDHRKPNCESNELYKGVMDEQSTGIFNGKIFVRQYAQKTNAFQSNKNIVLSNNASVNTKPQLEIWADDVKCSHGCTTGQLDAEQIFYLQSRGVSKQRAKAILLYAFVNDIVNKISLDNIRENIQKTITERLYLDLGVE